LKLPAVAPEAGMDDETLIKHMNARHMPMAGLTEVRPDNAIRGPGEKLLRRYHQHCHHRGYDDNAPGRPVNHDHAD
jgi:hypothetical protein